MARITPVTACTRNAVRVAEPSVWNQSVSRGTLRKRKYRMPPMRPDRSSSQSIGYMTACSMRCLRVDFGIRSSTRDVRRLQRVEPGFGSIDMLARSLETVLLDLRRGTGALDVRDAVRAQQDESVVLDPVLVAVERSHRR